MAYSEDAKRIAAVYGVEAAFVELALEGRATVQSQEERIASIYGVSPEFVKLPERGEDDQRSS